MMTVDTVQGTYSVPNATSYLIDGGNLILRDDDGLVVSVFQPNYWSAVRIERESKLRLTRKKFNPSKG